MLDNPSLMADDPTTKWKNMTNNEHMARGSLITYLKGHCAAEYPKSHIFDDPSVCFQKLRGFTPAFESTYIGFVVAAPIKNARFI